MAKQSIKVSTTIVKTVQLELDRKDIVQLLEAKGFNPPQGAGVYVQVPGGGDWSYTSLNIDGDCPIIVIWSETEEFDE